jgi:hypothetical protein
VTLDEHTGHVVVGQEPGGGEADQPAAHYQDLGVLVLHCHAPLEVQDLPLRGPFDLLHGIRPRFAPASLDGQTAHGRHHHDGYR